MHDDTAGGVVGHVPGGGTEEKIAFGAGMRFVVAYDQQIDGLVFCFAHHSFTGGARPHQAREQILMAAFRRLLRRRKNILARTVQACLAGINRRGSGHFRYMQGD